MNRTEALRPQFVEFVPGTLEGGVLYISCKYKTASHLCCCGCGNKVVTPLNPSGWKLTEQRGAVTLYPSIGNWNFPCESHYWIQENRIEWARKMSRQQIITVRAGDRLAQERYFDETRAASTGVMAWTKFKKWFVQTFFGKDS